MKRLFFFLLISMFVNNFAQDADKIANLEMRVSMLGSLVSETLMVVDSLKQSQSDLKLEFERYKWNLVQSDMDWSKVIAILGPPDLEETDKFGNIKYLYGNGSGYQGYVLMDKNKKVISASPPLNLRMKM